MIAFGPVPSRRLGRSVGVNHIPFKTCSYACVYCQLGRTTHMTITRQAFHSPQDLLSGVSSKVRLARSSGQPVDYITLVPDGEPTLDENLGRHIGMLRQLGLPIAVISNASLMGQPSVRAELLGADWVSLKMDAVQEQPWHEVDRPHGSLVLDEILEGSLAFSRSFAGKLVTETMLVAGKNDGAEQMVALTEFLEQLRPDVAYLAVPTRPPAEAWVHPPDEAALLRAYQILEGKLEAVEYLTGFEGSTFAYTGDAERDLLSITAVHPMRRDSLDAFLAVAGSSWDLVHRLIEQGEMLALPYGEHTFYLRHLASSPRRQEQ